MEAVTKVQHQNDVGWGFSEFISESSCSKIRFQNENGLGFKPI